MRLIEFFKYFTVSFIAEVLVYRELRAHSLEKGTVAHGRLHALQINCLTQEIHSKGRGEEEKVNERVKRSTRNYN